MLYEHNSLDPYSSINMRRLPQFVRLSVVLSRVCLASVSRLSVVLSRFCLASVCRLVSRLRASVSRLSRFCLASVVPSRVCLRRLSWLASVSLLSRVGRPVSRPSRVCLRRSSWLASGSRLCLASVCVRLASVSPCECLRRLAHFMSVVIQRV